MKDLKLLVWLSQLGLSTATPLIGFILLAVWLRNRFNLGVWVLLVGIGLGLLSAINGFVQNLKVLDKTNHKNEKEPPVSYGEHE